MTNKQIEIAEKLESLVYRRFNIDTLEKELSQIFGENIELHDVSDEVDTPDWNYTFHSDSDEYGGVFDIYVLHQRNIDFDFCTMLVTEVACDFGKNWFEQN